MYCPNCGTEDHRTDNQSVVKYCRKCGVNLSLVPQALTGNLPQVETSGRKRLRDRDKNRPPTIESGLRHTITGIGFLMVSLAVFLFAPAGKLWFWSFIFPAFGLLSKGIPEILLAQKQQNIFPQPQQHYNQQAIAPPPTPVNFQPRSTGELVQPPPSVTESTTKLFDPPK
jgi:hypothetical protein